MVSTTDTNKKSIPKKKSKKILPKKADNNFENGTVDIDDSVTDEDIRRIRTTD